MRRGREERCWRWLGWIVGGLVLSFLLLPLLVIVPMSFTSGNLLVFPLPGLSLRWYAEILGSVAWRDAAWNSLVIGTFATLLALATGVPAAIALAGAPFLGKRLILAVLLSPMIVPVVISAVAFYFFLVEIGLVGTYPGIILAHAILGVPFVVVTVTATLSGFDWNLMRAAANLGARPFTAFRRVMLPIIAPGVASGALFAFATSFDEIVVALFLGAPDQRTLPRQIFSGVREYVSPAIAAVATLLVLLAILLLVTTEWLRHRARRLQAHAPQP
jgi:putative spermidine/putrescine transport system permease protein